MSRELFSQIIAPLNKGVNQQANSLVLPGFSKELENGVCDLVEGLKKRLGSVPVKRLDTLTKNAGGQTLTAPIKWNDAWYFVYNRSSTERFVLIVADDSRTVSRTGDITNNSAVVTSVSSMTDLFVGAVVTGSGVPTGTTIVDIDTAGSRITLSQNATATTTGVTLTIESNLTFVSGVSNIEPLVGTELTVVPIEQVFSNVTTANLSYLRGSGRARDRFRATSFQDYVFVTNVQKEVAYDSTETLTRFNIGSISSEYQPTKAQVWVKLVDYDTEYSVHIVLDNDDEITGHYVTPSLTDSAGDTNIVSSADIASRLVSFTDTITGSLSTGSSTVSSVTADDMRQVHGGERITGTGIPANTFVGAVSTNSFTLVDEAGTAVNATANGSTSLTIGHGLDQTDIHNELRRCLETLEGRIGTDRLSY